MFKLFLLFTLLLVGGGIYYLIKNKYLTGILLIVFSIIMLLIGITTYNRNTTKEKPQEEYNAKILVEFQ